MEMEANWKYIVYCTTNVVNNKIYIGVHKTMNPDKFDGYIGNGVYVSQPNTYKYSKTKFQCAINKYGVKNFVRKTLACFDTEKEAYHLEEELVTEEFLKRDDVYNMILGGYAGLYIHQRIKVYQYDLDGKFITSYRSLIDAANCIGCQYSSISSAIKEKAKWKNSFWSTDKVEQLNIEDYDLRDNHAIQVHLYDLKGNYLESFSTVTALSKKIHACNETIRRAMCFGTLVLKKYQVCSEKALNFSEAKTKYIKNRPVYQYDQNCNFVFEYARQMDAEAKYPNANITKAIRLKQPDENNYFWSLEKLSTFGVKQKCNEKKKVGKYDLTGKLVCIYDSATQAAKENGTSVWKNLAGSTKTHKKHVYKYI